LNYIEELKNRELQRQQEINERAEAEKRQKLKRIREEQKAQEISIQRRRDLDNETTQILEQVTIKVMHAQQRQRENNHIK